MRAEAKGMLHWEGSGRLRVLVQNKTAALSSKDRAGLAHGQSKKQDLAFEAHVLNSMESCEALPALIIPIINLFTKFPLALNPKP